MYSGKRGLTGLRQVLSIGSILLLAALSTAAHAIEDKYEWGQRIKAARAVAPLGSSLFGDETNFFNGSTTFTVTDVDLPGNNALQVRIGRTLSTAQPEGPTSPALFGEWELDIPVMKGVFAGSGAAWQVNTATPTNRCSSPTSAYQLEPPGATTGNGTFGGDDYWRGNSLYVPGYGEQSVLFRDPATPQPTDGGTYKLGTIGNWHFRCKWNVTDANNVQIDGGGAGEGFVALAPDGTRYRFDHMVTRPWSILTRPVRCSNCTQQYQLNRVEVRIYPTLVQDRFGNTVTYSWTGDRLTQISSSDGRIITLAYDDTINAIKSVSTWHSPPGSLPVERKWTYGYSAYRGLSSVGLPDGTAWFLGTTPLIIGYELELTPLQCDDLGTWSSGTKTFTFTHPNGAQGVFEFAPTRHGRSKVTTHCQIVEGLLEWGAPILNDMYSLVSKTITGPSLPSIQWTITYPTPSGSYVGCSNCPTTKVVTVNNPDGSKIRHTFGTRYYKNEGKLLQSEVLTPSGAVLRTTASTFPEPEDPAPYVVRVGDTGMTYEDSFGSVMRVPQKSRTITDGGATFSSVVNLFDDFARAVSITKSSSLGHSKTEVTVYKDNRNTWTIGQIESINVGSDVPTSTEYDPVTSLPLRQYAFGKLISEYSYSANGTPASVTDGTGSPSHAITFSQQWRAGLPEAISFPDTTSTAAYIDEGGWVWSTTDQNGDETKYDYDPLGRIERIDYPVGGSVAWCSTTIAYQRLSVSELGFPVGTWRREEATCNYRERTYYDARLRPRLTEKMDVPGDPIFQRIDYDFEGRETFKSYPSVSWNATAGINTTYDAVGRVTLRKTTDLVTLESISYPAGKKVVTDARGYVTTFHYQAFDAPSYDVTTLIEAPEGQTTTIVRDVFGNMTSATQSGTYQSSLVTATRTYIYDQYKRLCKRIEPETNQRVIAYDLAGNIDWNADGQTGLTNACDYGSVAAVDKTVLTYDTLNRVTFADAPGTDADVTTTYWPTGDVHTLSTPTSIWTYTYNNRRMLETETLATDGLSFPTLYRFNPQGVMDQITYPSNRAVTLSPDALGRSRAVGNLATGINYHPNGAVQSFTYGNSLGYSMTLDSRMRPERLKVVAGIEDRVNLLHGYDAASNLTSIIDTGDVTVGADTRGMAYDGLNRLTTLAVEGLLAQDFTQAGAQSVSIPMGVSNVTMTLHGGGGGGGKGNNGGGGGGGGAYCQSTSLAIDDSEWGGVVNFTVGNAGAGGTGTGGTASSLVRTFAAGSVNLSAGGGGAGTSTTGGAGGVAGASCTIKTNGVAGVASNASTQVGGNGGSAPQGGAGGAGSAVDGGAGGVGGAPGGGGGGGGPRDVDYGILAGNGGAGAKGRVRFDWNIGTVTYSYDPLNNLRVRGGANPLNYGPNNTTNRLDSVTGALARTYTYDSRGQVTNDGTRSFEWNGAHRIKVTGTSTYDYDGLGRRYKTDNGGVVEYTVYSHAGTLLYSHKPGNGEFTDYVYLGGTPIAELRTVPGQITPVNPNNPAADEIVVFGAGMPPRVANSGTPNAQTTTTYLHGNALRSPIQWSGSGGAWMANEHYEAYGHKMNGVGDKLGYTGHAHDFETDLTYMQARYYDSQVGRFLSTDPVEFDGANPFTFNRYAYVNNNPYRYTDPTGMFGRAPHPCDEADCSNFGPAVQQSNSLPGPDPLAALRSLSPKFNFRTSKRRQESRVDGKIYVTGHRVGSVGPYHLALEYSEGGKTTVISAGPVDGLLVSDLDRPTDEPADNATIGQVQPPVGMSAGAYFGRLLQADLRYCDCVDYDTFPGMMNNYNSNSYVRGLINATDGTSSVNFDKYYGGPKPVPPEYFGGP